MPVPFSAVMVISSPLCLEMPLSITFLFELYLCGAFGKVISPLVIALSLFSKYSASFFAVRVATCIVVCGPNFKSFN